MSPFSATVALFCDSVDSAYDNHVFTIIMALTVILVVCHAFRLSP